MSWILTASGKHFDYLAPSADTIHHDDIASGLACESRFAGQCSAGVGFYSVAQHSVIAAAIVPKHYALEALLHDAAEAYCKDIPRPLKQLLPDYRAIEARVEAVIRNHFGLPDQQSAVVGHADLVMLATERRDLMPEDDAPWECLRDVEPLPWLINPVTPSVALLTFSEALRWACGFSNFSTLKDLVFQQCLAFPQP